MVEACEFCGFGIVMGGVRRCCKAGLAVDQVQVLLDASLKRLAENDEEIMRLRAALEKIARDEKAAHQAWVSRSEETAREALRGADETRAVCHFDEHAGTCDWIGCENPDPGSPTSCPLRWPRVTDESDTSSHD